MMVLMSSSTQTMILRQAVNDWEVLRQRKDTEKRLSELLRPSGPGPYHRYSRPLCYYFRLLQSLCLVGRWGYPPPSRRH